MEYILENRRTAVTDSCDVFVAGGGIAGISAALAAARTGAKVLLAERGFELGGLATAGLVTIYLPLCDGMGHQVSFGIAEELLRLSVKNGMENKAEFDPAAWLNGGTFEERRDGPRFEVQFNPHIFAIECERLLLREGVRLLYGTTVCDVHKNGDRIDAVILENKSGRSAVAVKSVADTTGDADVCVYAGCETETYHRGNVLAAWYYSLSDGEKQAVLRLLGYCENPEGTVETLTRRRFGGLDAKEITDLVTLSHEQTFLDMLKHRAADPSYTLSTIATIPQLRMTRRIIGEATLDVSDDHREFADSIGAICDWRKRGPVFNIPFGTLWSARVLNLITAGRMISVTEPMWDISRVIPPCAVTGEAAGTAAALSDDFRALDVNRLRARLASGGVRLSVL